MYLYLVTQKKELGGSLQTWVIEKRLLQLFHDLLNIIQFSMFNFPQPPQHNSIYQREDPRLALLGAVNTKGQDAVLLNKNCPKAPTLLFIGLQFGGGLLVFC